ncbi:putative MIF4G-like, type 3, initiation factor eIF-4 gamma, MA3, MIF4G-like domain superfamily [Helianthus debilis subsp. tardiflorus]
MSVNQSRGDKNEPPHYRRSGRSGNPGSPRNFSGGGGGGRGGGGTAGPQSSSAFYSGKSFKKVVSNAQGAQARVTGPVSNQNVGSGGSSNASTGGRGPGPQNGAHFQPPVRGTPDASSAGATVKPTDAPVQKSTPGLPKAPQSNTVSPGSGTTGPSTPVKGPADASKAFPLQFGSISPGVINGMQVPARTSSAPPNLDEQKRAQARLDSLKATSFQNPAVPNQHLPRKDPGPVDQPVEPRPTISKEKKDALSSPPVPVAAHSQKPTGPPIASIPTGVSMKMPYHQSQIHIPFGGPNPPLQSQNIGNTVPLPMHLPVGNPPPQVPPQVFVPGIQHHQGMIHQNQGLTFSSQMGPQLGNMGGMGMGIGPQYQHQQPMGNLNYGSARRTVKITHPDTHEELRLDKRTDGSSGQRSHMHPSQAFPPAAHPINYYPNSYNPNPLFPQPPGSNPLNSSQATPGSQPPRFYNQASKQVTVKQPTISSHAEKVGDSADKSQRAAGGESHPLKNSETTATSLPQSETTTNTSAAAEAEVAKKPTVNKSGSFKEEPNTPPGDKAGGQPLSVTSSSAAHHGSDDSVVQETSKLSTIPSETSKDVSETSNKVEGSSNDNNEQGVNSTPQVGWGDNAPNVEETVVSEEQVKESVDQNQDVTVPDVTVNNIDGSISASDVDDKKDDQLSKFDVDQVNASEPVSVSASETSSLTSEVEATGSIHPSSSSNKVKGNTGAKGKKKIKEILKNADARGTTSDLYNAYKRPEEKKETSSATEVVENPNPPVTEKDVLSRGPAKVEPDDWEDAADLSTPKMETGLKQKHHSEVDNDGMTKKYSRDFLLKFSDHCTDLPEGFEITPDINEVFVGTGVNAAREPYPSPGRGGGDRSAGGSRLDRRPSNVGLDDKWNKVSGGPMGPGWDPMGYPTRGNHGVLRTPRGQPPGQYPGGILSGPMQSPGPHMQRNNSDSDRWQRATGYQKGLMPSPHTPMMHKADRKYEVGKVTDEEQAKQRRLKGILNKLTPQNFEKLFDQVKEVNIDNADTLSGVIGQIFDKALMEPTFVEMYANFCSRLAVELPGFGEDNEKITFKRLLLNKCQEEFERGEREEEEANRTEEEGEMKQSEEEREEKRVKARRRMLGNIRLIGELYKKRMLTERIMHECIKKLLGINQNQNPNPDEENIEALCKLMSTIGEMIDHPKAKEHMDVYFDMMYKLSNNMTLSSRVRFMLKDAIDLRKNKWQQRRKVEGPKKIEEVHRDAANERHAQSSRLARGPNSNPSLRRGGQPMDFGPKGSAGVLPSNPQMGGGFRGLPQQQMRGFGNQDSRFDSYDNRTLSVPLRPMGDDSITLGPQGGLARGMSVRGQPSMQGVAGPNNGYGGSMIPDRGGYSQREDLASRYMPERFSPRPGFEPSNIQEHNMNNANRRGFDRVRPSTPPERARVSTPPQSGSSDKPVLSEDRLHDMSIEAIKEFYSARDEKEVALCIKDLNAPGFYPSMISIWVTDSFERKDMDRDSLAKLLVNLTKSQGGILTQDSLVRGFESVLSTLEDAVNDAPKAAEFLGRMFARILIENVIPYKQVWRLIYEGGEEQGRLVQTGLAADVLGVILEIIKSEKGDPFLHDLRASSNLRLENFRPPTLKKTSRLDKFI